MNKTFSRICASIMLSVVVNIFIYNYRVIVETAFGIDPGVSRHSVARYLIYLIIGYILRNHFAGRKGFWELFVPVLLIDSLTLFTGPKLIPLRFPFDTIYPLLGLLTGRALSTQSPFRPAVLFTLSAVFITTAELYIRPYLIWIRHLNDQPPTSINRGMQKLAYLDKEYLTVTGRRIRISDTLRQNLKLLEFYFVGCAPCEEKYESIKTLKKRAPYLDIALVCDGDISSFQAFKTHAAKNQTAGITFLYDEARILASSPWIKGYPTEIIYKDKTVAKIGRGFSKEIEQNWLERQEGILLNLRTH